MPLEPAPRPRSLPVFDVAEALKRVDASRIEVLADPCAQSGITGPATPRALDALAVGIEALGVDAGTQAMRLLLRGR